MPDDVIFPVSVNPVVGFPSDSVSVKIVPLELIFPGEVMTEKTTLDVVAVVWFVSNKKSPCAEVIPSR